MGLPLPTSPTAAHLDCTHHSPEQGIELLHIDNGELGWISCNSLSTDIRQASSITLYAHSMNDRLYKVHYTHCMDGSSIILTNSGMRDLISSGAIQGRNSRSDALSSPGIATEGA